MEKLNELDLDVEGRPL
nr:hypothetical protein [Klebsiella pneumoniae]